MYVRQGCEYAGIYMLPVCYAGFIMHALTRQRYMSIHSNVALHHALHIIMHNVRMYAIHINACIVNTTLGCSYWCTSIQHELDTYMQYYISL